MGEALLVDSALETGRHLVRSVQPFPSVQEATPLVSQMDSFIHFTAVYCVTLLSIRLQ